MNEWTILAIDFIIMCGFVIAGIVLLGKKSR